MRKLRMSELNRLSVEKFQDSEKHPVAIVLDDVRSNLNVGSVFRTSDAFLIEYLLLCGITPTPNREMNKTALGATDAVAWKYFKNSLEALDFLRERGYRIWAVEQTTTAIPLGAFTPAEGEKTALVFGHEVRGVSQLVLDRCDGALEIPQWGTKHSLNISVSVGIALWELIR